MCSEIVNGSGFRDLGLPGCGAGGKLRTVAVKVRFVFDYSSEGAIFDEL